MSPPLWTPTPTQVAQSKMSAFISFVNRRHALHINDYATLHRWSVEQLEAFWSSVWTFCNVIASKEASHILQHADSMETASWFQGARLNFAENLLRRRDQHTAIIAVNEQDTYLTLSYADLFHHTAVLANWLREQGIRAGDRIAAFMPNVPETIIAMLATTSLGALWSSCSPDFGLHSILERFEQIEPTILFATTEHLYNGKVHSHTDTLLQLQKQLVGLKQTVVVSFIQKQPDIKGFTHTVLWDDIQNSGSTAPTLVFEQLPFQHPAFILYSSGTTGKPKCIVHSAGGTLLQHLKELCLHTDLNAHDRFFFYTSCGWMMWNWLVSGLATGCTLVLYEGSPFFPQTDRLLQLIDSIGITIFGASPKWIETLKQSKISPQTASSPTDSLQTLRTLLTTGAPLLPAQFDYVYRDIKNDLRLASISGGTDILSCFALGNPLTPVYRGELSGPGLGMDVKIFDDAGQPLQQEKGELVCCSPFPSMPLYFWNDPNHKKFHAAYFNQYPQVWAHGDYAQWTPHGGLIIHGRSDATLNPGGIRIGTAEIYQLLSHISEISDSIAVGQSWQGDERMILLVVMQENTTLTPALQDTIKQFLKKNASPHHVPAKIVAVPDLPRTINGKPMELAVKALIHHEPIQNRDTIANPESLDSLRAIINHLERP